MMLKVGNGKYIGLSIEIGNTEQAVWVTLFFCFFFVDFIIDFVHWKDKQVKYGARSMYGFKELLEEDGGDENGRSND